MSVSVKVEDATPHTAEEDAEVPTAITDRISGILFLDQSFQHDHHSEFIYYPGNCYLIFVVLLYELSGVELFFNVEFARGRGLNPLSVCLDSIRNAGCDDSAL